MIGLLTRLVYTWNCNQIGILFPAAHAAYIQIILNYLELLKAHLEEHAIVNRFGNNQCILLSNTEPTMCHHSEQLIHV